MRCRPARAKSNLAGKTGGAVTLAVGMAKVFSSLPGMKALMSYWYHFVIMFEALFILTLLETGTRVARFIFQETVHQFLPKALAGRRDVNLGLNVVMSVVVCALWGYLLYSGNIATLWRMMGIANQLLATIALAIGTTYLLKHAPRRAYALCTGIPLVFVVATVFTAGVESIQSWWRELATLAPGSPEAFYLHSFDPGGHHAGAVGPGGSRFARRWVALLRAPTPRGGTGRKGGVTCDRIVTRVQSAAIATAVKRGSAAAGRACALTACDNDAC